MLFTGGIRVTLLCTVNEQYYISQCIGWFVFMHVLRADNCEQLLTEIMMIKHWGNTQPAMLLVV